MTGSHSNEPAAAEEAVTEDIEQRSTRNDENDQSCGILGFTTDCLKNFVLLFVCLVTAFVWSEVLSIHNSALVSTFEKRFDWTTRTVGFVLSSSEFGFLATAMFIAHFGSTSHRPRLFGAFTLATGATGFVFFLPFILLGPKFSTDEVFSYSLGHGTNSSGVVQSPAVSNKIPYCIAGRKESIAQSAKASVNDSLPGSELNWSMEFQSSVALGLFMLGGALQGVTLGPFWNVAYAFIDDMTKQWSGVFVGIYTLLQSLSPILGYQIAARTTQLNENLGGTLSQFADSQNSPLWIGAWWLGYLVIGIVVMTVSLPLFCFPRSVPLRVATDPSRVRNPVLRLLLGQSQKESDNLQQEELSHADSRKQENSFVGLLRSMKRIFSNPVYICLFVGNSFEFAATIGQWYYGAKYVEQHFGVTQSEASAITGVMMPLSVGLGLTISILVSYRFQLSMYSLTRFNAFVRLFGILRYFLGAVFVCATPRVLTSVQSAPGEFVVNGSYCGSTGCSSCSSSGFFPVCGDNATTFFSPCAAGCSDVGGLDSGCVCTGSGSVRLGSCEGACYGSLTGYAIMTVLLGTLQTSASTQESVITMRCVQPRDKALALASLNVLWGVIGCMLPPLIGSAFDSICLIKSHGSHCELYDREAFRYVFHLPSGFAQTAGCLFFFLLWYFSAKRYGRESRDTAAAEMPRQEIQMELPEAGSENVEATTVESALNRPC